jgi:predicted nucleic acid-binding protein
MGSRAYAEALALRQKAKLIAPELLVAECADILWKKVQRRELLKQEALIGGSLSSKVRLQATDSAAQKSKQAGSCPESELGQVQLHYYKL